MSCHCGENVRETETVRQHDVIAFMSEFGFEEFLPEENVLEQRFR